MKICAIFESRGEMWQFGVCFWTQNKCIVFRLLAEKFYQQGYEVNELVIIILLSPYAILWVTNNIVMAQVCCVFVSYSSPPPPIWGCVVLHYLRSPKVGCCSVLDDLSCSYLSFAVFEYVIWYVMLSKYGEQVRDANQSCAFAFMGVCECSKSQFPLRFISVWLVARILAITDIVMQTSNMFLWLVARILAITDIVMQTSNRFLWLVARILAITDIVMQTSNRFLWLVARILAITDIVMQTSNRFLWLVARILAITDIVMQT